MVPRPRQGATGMKFSLTVLRSSGGKDEFQLSPSDTLESLKNLISKSKLLGRIGPSDQRVFHLGRELKTPGRSLASLGVDASRFGVCVIHVHSRRPGRRDEPEEDDSDDDDDEVVCVSVHPPAQPRRHVQNPPAPAERNRAGEEVKEVIDLLDDSSDEEEEQQANAHRSKRARA